MSGPRWAQEGYFACSGSELEETELAISLLGRFRSCGHFRMINSDHDACALHIVHEGDGVVEHRGRAQEASAGATFCFFPGERYSYFDQPDKPWRYTWVRLSGSRAAALLGNLGFSPGHSVRTDIPCQAASGLLDEVQAVYRSDEHSVFYPQAAGWSLLDRLSPPKLHVERGVRLAAICKRILDERYRQPLQLAELARELGVDRSTLFRHFSAVYGCAPKDYLDSLRLEHARALLTDGVLSVSEIAFRCGYASLARFSQAFKTRFGEPPSRFLRTVK